MRSLLVIFAIVVAAVLASKDDITLSYKQGSNLTDAATNFAYRTINNNWKKWSYMGVDVHVFTWHSTSVSAEATDEEKESGNAIIGFGMFPSEGDGWWPFPPFALVSVGDGKDTIDVDLNDFTDKVSGSKEIKNGFKGNFMAMYHLNIQEYTPAGKKVTEASFQHKGCKPSEVVDENGNIKAYSCTYDLDKGKATLTYLSSKYAGVLTYGAGPLSPRTLEHIIEIQDFPLSSEENHLCMRLGLFSPSKSVVEDNVNVIHREDHDDVYIALSKYARVNGINKDVQVQIKSESFSLETVPDKIIPNAVGSGKNAMKYVAYIDFPANVTSFIYDPAFGAGKNVYDACPNTDPDPGTGSTSKGTGSTTSKGAGSTTSKGTGSTTSKATTSTTSKGTGSTTSKGTGSTSTTSKRPYTPAQDRIHHVSSANTATFSLLAILVSLLIYLF